MKTVKFIALFLTMLIMNSCTGKDEIEITSKGIDEETEQEELSLDSTDPLRQHLLWLGFQDASGNDLLKGSEFVWDSEYGMRDIVKPEFYTLDIIFPDDIPNPRKPGPAPMINVDGVWIPSYILDVRYPRLYLAEGLLSPPEYSADSDYTYLWFDTGSYRDSDFPEKITLRLTYPYLFGDDEAHDIVTWWKPFEVFDASCLCVEFDGEVYEPSYFNRETRAVATIIIDR